MEHRCRSPDRRQRRGEHRTRSPLPRFFACGTACFDRVAGAEHRSSHPHLDSSEHPTGIDLRIYCEVGFESDFSPPIRGVVDPWGDLAESGRRVLTVAAVPNYYFYQPTSTVLNVRPKQYCREYVCLSPLVL